MECPHITNVIASVLIQNDEALHLPFLASRMEGSRYNPRRFSGLILRKVRPKGTIILYRSNRFLVVGSNSVEDCEILARRVIKDVRKIINKKVELREFKVVNIIAKGDIGRAISLDSLAEEPFAYKDDHFAGVVMKLEHLKCVMVYKSGKVTLNGAKTT